MAEIKNKTIKAEFVKIADILNSRGQNLNAEHVAAVIVRYILSEVDGDMLTDEYKTERAEYVANIKTMITAAKNFQNSYLAGTKRDGSDEPIMKALEKGETKVEASEFC